MAVARSRRFRTHVAIGILLARFVDGAHATDTQFADDLVGRDALGGIGGIVEEVFDQTIEAAIAQDFEAVGVIAQQLAKVLLQLRKQRCSIAGQDIT